MPRWLKKNTLNTAKPLVNDKPLPQGPKVIPEPPVTLQKSSGVTPEKPQVTTIKLNEVKTSKFWNVTLISQKKYFQQLYAMDGSRSYLLLNGHSEKVSEEEKNRLLRMYPQFITARPC